MITRIAFLMISITAIFSVTKGEETVMFDREKPFIVVDEKGALDIIEGDSTFARVGIGVHGREWAYANQGSARISRDSREGDARELDGVLAIPRDPKVRKMLFRIKAGKLRTGGIALSYEFEFPDGAELKGYQVSVWLRLDRFRGARVIDLTTGDLIAEIPSKFESQQIGRRKTKGVKIVDVRGEDLLLRLSDETPMLVQDNRAYNSDEIELRFSLPGVSEESIPPGSSARLGLSITAKGKLQTVLDRNSVTCSTDTSGWFPFVLPWDDVPLDLSHLNEKPAGKHGFLTVDGDRFVFEDGTPIRFWGTCFSAAANFPTHEQSEKIARRLAKLGINIVRTHHADAGWSRPNLFRFDDRNPKDNTLSFDPESLDRFDYLIYCLKQNGIYVYLDQLVHRKFGPGDGVDAYDKLDNAAKPYSNFDPRLIELQKKFSHDLWTHVNPYTGLAYKDDPAIVLMEFANENDLFTQRVTLEPYRSRLEERYRDWAARNGVHVGPEEVDFTDFSEPIIRFLHEVQKGYYDEMRGYLRGIGVRVPMTGSNWSRNLALLSALSGLDYTDSHSYWDHPSNGEQNNKPMVTEFGNVFAWLSFNRLYGKPFFVSEWDQPWPNDWRAEHPLAIAAVAALQGWNGLTGYTYRHSTATPVDTLSGAFEMFNDPCRYGLFYHAALIYRRGDVSESKRTTVIFPDPDRILASPNPQPWNIVALRGIAEQNKVAMALYERPEGVDEIVSPYEPTVDESSGVIVSDTGELRRNWRTGIGVIDTARTKAVYGRVGQVDSIELDGMTIACATPFATIAASSLDDSPISESGRILITAVGRAENTGMKFDVLRRRLIDRGTGPILVEPVEATIELATSLDHLIISPVDANGERTGEVPFELTDGKLKLQLSGKWRTIYYLVERVGGKE